MFKIIILIILLILILFIFVLFIRCKLTNSKLKDLFKNHSTITFGAKGKGKDLLFQKVIYLRRKETYLSNTPYGFNYIHTPIKDLSVKPNTYRSFISGDITIIEKNEDFEGKDYYLSDSGVYLPCQYDYELNKLYPSFPVFYALSRHLYNMNIHMNTQNLERPWKIVREQADYYIMCRGKIKLLFGMICKIRFYEKYDSACNRLLPIGSRLFNKFSKAEVDQYNSTHGEIKNAIYYIRYKDIKYDTRIFHQILFNKRFVTTKQRKEKVKK